ncbi:SGNH/GDSL hydrolase family protein [Blastococcus sp. TF02-9]|uniref:SGNH/GDSL hydrolase family protein n=1 Tax=Blastococcus sp. TF02-09 TaxID=2250576 RepID=UPI001314471A|nr:SGNH/GDSL hydrolase family protein [Blastococcus sp. TF02-9]
MARAPERPGFFRSLPLPSRAEGLVIAALLLVTAIGVGLAAWYASNRNIPEFEAPPDAGGTTAPSPAAADAPVLAFYGDRYVVGTQLGGLGPTGWPALVSQRLGAQATEPHGAIDTGYVAGSIFGGLTYEAIAAQQPEPDADITIVFGSRNDFQAPQADITAAATRTFDIIRANAPGTQLLVIGPAWTDAAVPPELPPVRDAVRQAALAAGVTFVDPLAERWFFDDVGLIGPDLISPNDAGHAYLADQIEPFVRELLSDAATPAAATDAGPP